MTNSHILVAQFAYQEPATLTDAIAVLARYGERARVLAGGTDLLVHMKMERAAPEALVSLRRIAGLDQMALEKDALSLGALATIDAVCANPAVRAHTPALAEACDSFSTRQVQVMGTIGGNLANGSPASDSAPALLAFGAQVVLQGPAGRRTLPLDQFLLAPGKTALQPGELLVEIRVPRPPAGAGSAFLKMSRVAADIAKANAAVVLVRDGERVVEGRLAFGSVAPTPVRTPLAEAALKGQRYSEKLIADAARLAAEQVAPIDDVRSDAAYRREIVRVMAYDGLARAWERASRPPAAWTVERRPAPAQVSAPAVVLSAADKRKVTLTVNGSNYSLWVSPNELLLNVLREGLELTGTKYGCGIGECSACTILFDGKPALACLILAVSAEGHSIQTVEGLQGPLGELDPLQEAFLENAAFQCGYCTPGMLMTAKALLAETPHPDEDEIRNYLRGNICRCTGYASIVRAVMDCAAHAPASTEVS